MSPNRRRREYARRRYQKWQTKQAARLVKRRRVRRGTVSAVAAVAVVAIGWGVISLVTAGGSPSAATTASSSATSTATSTASATSTAAATNPCAVPTVTPPATPKSWPTPPPSTLAAAKTWQLTLETTCGPILLDLDGAKAPKAVSSMVFLAQQGFFDSTPCHRLTTTGIYVLQCGDPTGSGTGGPGYTYGPVENAPKNDVYPAGTVAMARQSGNGTSMGSQFFLVYKDSTIPSDAAGGYTVVGTITGGLGTLEKIAAGGVSGGGGDGAPARAVSITSTTVTPK